MRALKVTVTIAAAALVSGCFPMADSTMRAACGGVGEAYDMMAARVSNAQNIIDGTALYRNGQRVKCVYIPRRGTTGLNDHMFRDGGYCTPTRDIRTCYVYFDEGSRRYRRLLR